MERDSKAPRPFLNEAGIMVDPTTEPILPFLKKRLPYLETPEEVIDWFEKRGKERDLMEEKIKESVLKTYFGDRAS